MTEAQTQDSSKAKIYMDMKRRTMRVAAPASRGALSRTTHRATPPRRTLASCLAQRAAGRAAKPA